MARRRSHRHKVPFLKRHVTAVAVVLGAVVVLAAVLLFARRGDSEEKLVASARVFIEKNEHRSAIIQLKSALQKNPNSGQTRLLLGQSLLESGDAAAALVELRKAQELAVPDSELLPLLARAMLQGREAAKVSSQYEATVLPDAKANADLATSVASAFAAQGDNTKALESTRRALQSQPGYAPAIVLQAQLKLADRDTEGALFLLDEVLKKEPGNQRAGTLKGELLWLGKQDRAGALAVYRQVLASHPKSVQAHSAVVRILGEQGEEQAAQAALAELVKAAPNHPETVYLRARAAYQARDYRGARDLVDPVLKSLPDNVNALELAGAAELRLKDYQQAETHLARALKLAPNRVLSRNLLAQTLLRSGQADRAIEVLQGVLDNPRADGLSLAIAGEALMQVGDSRRADEAFRRAAIAAPQDTQVRTSVALAQLSRGEAGIAVPELEALAADDKSPRPDLALVAERLRRKDYDGALKAIAGLEKKLPESALPGFLRGQVLLAKGDRAEAVRALEAAVAKEPAYFPAVAALAALEIAAGKPELAKKRFEALAQADPKNFRARLALAEIANQAGAGPAEIRRLLQDAIKAAPDQAQPRVLLVNLELRSGDPKAALVAAQDAAAALPNQAEVLDALGRAQLAARDSQQAISTFKKAAALQPTKALPLVRLAEAYAAASDNAAARLQLRRAIELEPALPLPRRALIALALADKRPDEALAVARELQAKAPKDGAGFALEGEIEISRRNLPAAAAALRAALQRSKTTDNAIALHGVLLAGNQRAEADRHAADWLRDHPKDAGFRYYLGDLALRRSDWAMAESRYREVAALQPSNAMALNNIAWLMVKQGKPGAVPLAEQANALLPGRAPLLDTLAGALAAEGQLPRAIETQKSALERNPDDGAMRLALARLYIQAGDKAQARGELQTLARLGDKFRRQGEVTELLKTVQ